MGQEAKYPEVPVEKLRWRCLPESLSFETTAEIQPSMEIIGQERALKSIRLGLEMDSLGYNIFIVDWEGQTPRSKPPGESTRREKFRTAFAMNHFKIRINPLPV
jgi:hypothetical protein